MKYTVLAAIPCQQYHKEYLERAGRGNCRFIFCPELKNNWPESINQAILEADIIIGEPPLSLVQSLAARPENRLKWIQMTWAGTDIYTGSNVCNAPEKNCGEDEADRQQEKAELSKEKQGGFPPEIKLTNMSGAFGSIIAEYAIGGILYFYRNFSMYYKQKKKKLWQDAGSEETLEGKNILVLGTGNIGREIAKRLEPFGVHLVGFRRNIVDKPPHFHEICGQDTLKEHMKGADIIIGCLPGSPSTKHLIGKKELLSMKKDALFVNVGRGNLVNTKDLEEVLVSGHMKGAVLDVTDPEPLPKESPLWNLDNVLLTPHVAGVSFGHCKETEDKIIEICAENLIHFIKKEPLRNEIR